MNDGEMTSRASGEPRSFGNGRYVVRRRLGAGNFATVFLAYDERLDVLVAVKLLSDRWSWDPEVRGRFVQEARLLRSINDPRVIQIRDIDETDDGRPYLVMDLATGGTLEQRLIEAAQRGERLGAGQLRAVAGEVAAALAVLHHRRIAHRDIKPSNLLISGGETHDEEHPPGGGLLRPGERLLLGDLGLAKNLAFDSGVTVGVGTAGYMAPEQSGPGGRVDTRTDIFAASAVIAQIASGEPPDPIRRVSNGAVESGRPLPPSIPAPLAAVLARGMDIDPDKRQQTIEQWYEEIDPVLLALENLPSPPVAGTSPATPPTARSAPALPPPPAPAPPGAAGTPTVPLPLTAAIHPSSAPGAAPRRPPRRAALGAAVALVVAVIVVLTVVVRARGSESGASGTDPRPSRRTTVVPRTTQPAAVTTGQTTIAVTTEPPTTAPPGTTAVAVVGTIGASVASGAPDVSVPPVETYPDNSLYVALDGPTDLAVGEQGIWYVDAPGASIGVWGLSGPVQITPGMDGWTPGSYFQGIWNVPCTCTLTLTVYDQWGYTGFTSITFTVS